MSGISRLDISRSRIFRLRIMCYTTSSKIPYYCAEEPKYGRC